MSKKKHKNEEVYTITPAGRMYIIRSLIESGEYSKVIEYCKTTEKWMAKNIIYKTYKKEKK